MVVVLPVPCEVVGYDWDRWRRTSWKNIFLAKSVDALYRSGKYTDGYKLSVVNGTDRKAIKKEANAIKKERKLKNGMSGGSTT